MRAKIYRFISKHGSILCALAILVAPIACEQCRVLFYEPVEPKGLDMFIKEHKNNFKESLKVKKPIEHWDTKLTDFNEKGFTFEPIKEER